MEDTNAIKTEVETPITADEIAYVGLVADKPKDGLHYKIALAFASGGYQDMKLTGDARDPLFVQKGDIYFGSYAAATAEAERRNTTELHLDPRRANRIVAASMTGGVGMGGRG